MRLASNVATIVELDVVGWSSSIWSDFPFNIDIIQWHFFWCGSIIPQPFHQNGRSHLDSINFCIVNQYIYCSSHFPWTSLLWLSGSTKNWVCGGQCYYSLRLPLESSLTFVRLFYVCFMAHSFSLPLLRAQLFEWTKKLYLSTFFCFFLKT